MKPVTPACWATPAGPIARATSAADVLTPAPAASTSPVDR